MSCFLSVFQKLLLVQAGSVKPECEGASSVKAQDTALGLPSPWGGAEGRDVWLDSALADVSKGQKHIALCPSLPTPRTPALCCLLAEAKSSQMPQMFMGEGPVKETVAHSYSGVLQDCIIYIHTINWLSLLK